MVAVYRVNAARALEIAVSRRRVTARWRPFQSIPDVPANALSSGRIGGGPLTAARLSETALSAGRITP